MKLQPRQMIGLVAIVVFGGGMLFRLTQPSEREIMERRIASLPTISPSMEPLELPRVEIPVTGPIAPPITLNSGGGTADSSKIYELTGIDYFARGTQAAKDDLYCGGLLGAEFSVRVQDSHPDKASMLLRDSQALDRAGLDKLIAEGVTTEQASAGYTLAYADKAETDYNASTPRISVADCTARAAALN